MTHAAENKSVYLNASSYWPAYKSERYQIGSAIQQVQKYVF